MSSAFTSSQIIGGILIGAAGDAGILSRKKTLLLSFVGSAFAYGVIGFAGRSFYAVVVSRVIIGLVKQTMTVGTALLVRHTTKAERATQMGRYVLCYNPHEHLQHALNFTTVHCP